MEKFFEEDPDAAVNCETELYQCPSCNMLKTECNLGLYRISGSDDKPINYWAKWCDKEYRFVKSYIHRCPECRTRMHKLKRIPESITCPNCGAMVDLKDNAHYIMWD